MTSLRTPSFRAALILAAVGLLAACGSDGGSGSEPSGTDGPPTPGATLPSAAGKPCVAVSDPLPEGAPDVPVKVGPAPTELVIEDLAPGSGTVLTESASAVADYIGVACTSGTVFGSSYADGQPLSFTLGGVIQGWKQGLAGMKVGGKRLLGIPGDLAYGAEAGPPGVIADEALWFVVELKSVA